MIYQAIRCATTTAIALTLTACAGMSSESATRLRSDAMAAYDNGRYAQAAARLERYLDRTPDDVQAWYRLGNARAQQGGLEAALTAYEKALERDAEHTRARYNRGLVRVRLGLTGLRQAREEGGLDPGTWRSTHRYLGCLVADLQRRQASGACPASDVGDGQGGSE